MLILQNLVNNRWVSKGHKPKPSWHMRILVLHYHRISDLPVLAEMFIECFCHDTIVCKLIGNLLNTYKPRKKTLKKLLTVRELDQAYIFKMLIHDKQIVWDPVCTSWVISMPNLLIRWCQKTKLKKDNQNLYHTQTVTFTSHICSSSLSLNTYLTQLSLLMLLQLFFGHT